MDALRLLLSSLFFGLGLLAVFRAPIGALWKPAVGAKAGVPHLLLELPWGTHGCDANPGGPGGQITTWAVERFVARVFEAAPPA